MHWNGIINIHRWQGSGRAGRRTSGLTGLISRRFFCNHSRQPDPFSCKSKFYHWSLRTSSWSLQPLFKASWPAGCALSSSSYLKSIAKPGCAKALPAPVSPPWRLTKIQLLLSFVKLKREQIACMFHLFWPRCHLSSSAFLLKLHTVITRCDMEFNLDWLFAIFSPTC